MVHSPTIQITVLLGSGAQNKRTAASLLMGCREDLIRTHSHRPMNIHTQSALTTNRTVFKDWCIDFR